MKNESEIIEQLKSSYHFSLKDVPEELRTEKVCINALKYSFANSINYVPNDILSESFLSKRIRSTKKAIEVVKNVNDAFLRFIPSSLKNSDVCIASVIANPNNFKYLPDSFIDEKFLMDMVLINGELLKFVPPHLKTRELCQKAFKQNKNALRYFPENLITLDDCKKYIKVAWEISYIPKKFLSASLLALGIRSKPHRQDRRFYNGIHKSLITIELIIEMVRLDGHYLYRMGSEWKDSGFLTKDTLHRLVKVNGYCLEGIEKYGLITEELCLAALDTEYERLPKRARSFEKCLLKYFPKKIINAEVTRKAMAITVDNIQYISKSYQTHEMCKSAVMQNESNIKFISKKLLSLDLCLEAVKSSGYAIKLIPYEYQKSHPFLMASTNNIPLFWNVESCYPNSREFNELIHSWLGENTIDEADIEYCLINAPSKLKKTQVWKKYALMLNVGN
jgi:hypothetical protein